MSSMMISVCSTLEYRTIIHFDAHFDPKVILKNSLDPVCVLSDDVTTGHPENTAKICILFEKVQWHSIKCGISNSMIFIIFFGFVDMELYTAVAAC